MKGGDHEVPSRPVSTCRHKAIITLFEYCLAVVVVHGKREDMLGLYVTAVTLYMFSRNVSDINRLHTDLEILILVPRYEMSLAKS